MGEMFKRPVDYGKLIEALKEKELTPQKAGLKLGYSTGAFTQARREGMMTERLIVGLDYLGISYDKIKPEETETATPKQETPVPTVVNVTITPEVISEALVNVMMNQEVRNNLIQIVYYAVNKAIRNNSN